MLRYLPIACLCLPLALGGCAEVAAIGGAAVAAKSGVDDAYGLYATWCPAANAAQDALQDYLDAKAAATGSKAWSTASALMDRLAAAGSAACSDAVAKPTATLANELTLAVDAVNAFEAAQ